MGKKDIEQLMEEHLVEKPVVFTMEYTTEKKSIWGKTRRKIHRRRYKLYPPTTGKIKALSALLRGIEIDEERLRTEPVKEGLRLADEYAPEVAAIIALALRNTKAEIQDTEGVRKDAEFILWHARPESMASLLLIAITQSDYQSLVSVIRLSKKIWTPSGDTEKNGRTRTKARKNS